MKIFIYYLEIVRGILGKSEQPIDGIKYCAGWNDFEGMGISVLGLCEITLQMPHLPIFSVWLAEDLDRLVSKVAAEADLLIGFNNIRFDDRVIDAATSGAWALRTSHIPRYDILREIWAAEGHALDRFDLKVHGNYGLNAMCVANGLPTKTGNGAFAPVDWQQGRESKVINYCLHDVALTYGLLDLIETNRNLKAPDAKGGHRIPMRLMDRHTDTPITSEVMPWHLAE